MYGHNGRESGESTNVLRATKDDRKSSSLSSSSIEILHIVPNEYVIRHEPDNNLLSKYWWTKTFPDVIKAHMVSLKKLRLGCIKYSNTKKDSKGTTDLTPLLVSLLETDDTFLLIVRTMTIT